MRDLHDVAAALGAQPGMKQQTFVAGIKNHLSFGKKGRRMQSKTLNYSVWCDDSIALINEEQSGFIAVKGVQLLFAGAAAIQHHVMISADLL